ncbi:IPT/TIG domain-containing protein [bacterium]|nr:IPT/TIG domain-containing protein [bacterium]
MKKPARVSAFIALLAALAAAFAIYWLFGRPRIDALEGAALSGGRTLTIRGENFGERQGRGRVLLDGQPLTKLSYLFWSSKEIRAIVPGSVDSGLLRVATPFGLSNPEIVIAADRVPQAPSGEAGAQSGPVIASVDPQEAEIGGLVEIRGINFGSDIHTSAVRFSRNAAGGGDSAAGSAAAPASAAGDSGTVAPSDPTLMYERWDDKTILARVPEGAGSGAIVVSTPQGDSAPFAFRVKAGAGSKYLFDPVTYSVRLSVKLRSRSEKPQGTVVVYAPNLPETFSQRVLSARDESPAPFMDDYGRARVYKLQDLPAGETEVGRTLLVKVYRQESNLDGYRGSFAAGELPGFLKPTLDEDALVPAGAAEVREIAAKLAGREQNPQRKAVLVAGWLAKNLAWRAMPSAKETPLAALKARSAGTRSTALIACALLRASKVPARPVAGFLVRRDGVSLSHYWVEYYLPSVGWIPWDPVLAGGNKPLGFDAGLEDASHYFGALDNRHIAVSEGLAEISPLLGGDASQTAKASWSFQTLFEESLGADYASVWQELKILESY